MRVTDSVFSPSVLLCFFSSIAEEKIYIKEEKVTRQEGSCVTIDCDYTIQDNMQLLWIKDPAWNHENREFDGKIVYSNTNTRPQDSEYSGRAEYVYENKTHTNIKRAKCTLKINHLKKNDSGNYTFRYIMKSDKFMSKKMSLTVTGESYNLCERIPNSIFILD